MVKAVSALSGAKYSGFAEVSDAGLRGMITVRGDLKSAAFAETLTTLTGCDMPGVGELSLKRSRGIGWMSPDEVLVLGPYASATKDAAQLEKALAGTHCLVANVSDARAVFTITGGGALDVLSKLSPADLSTGAFGPGQLRRSRFAQAPAAFWYSGKEQINLVCFRSVAGYMFDLLSNAAHPASRV